MKTISITIPDRLIEEIEKTQREPSEVIIESLNKLLDTRYKNSDLHRWQMNIEKKLSDIQYQLDEHRMKSSDVAFDFDSDANKRLAGKKPLIAPDDGPPSLVRQVKKTISAPPKKRIVLEEIDVDLSL